MAKLTRHLSLEALKAHVPSPQVSAGEREQAHDAFEKFILLLQRERIISKKQRFGHEQ